MKRLRNSCLGHNLPLVAHTKLKTSRNVKGKQSSRSISLISTHTIYFLSYARQRRKKKKENELNQNFVFGFLDLVKVSETFRKDLALE